MAAIDLVSRRTIDGLPDGTYLVRLDGETAVFTAGPAVALRLEDAGRTVRFGRGPFGEAYGDHRTPADPAADGTLRITTGDRPEPEPGERLVAEHPAGAQHRLHLRLRGAVTADPAPCVAPGPAGRGALRRGPPARGLAAVGPRRPGPAGRVLHQRHPGGGPDLLNEPAPARDASATSPELAELVTDAGGIVAQLPPRSDQLDVARLQVNAPPEVRDDVDVLVARTASGVGWRRLRAPSEEAGLAFGRILVDYQRRCLYQG